MPAVLEYIKNLDFDVLCLQEVTPVLLKELESLPFHLTKHIDVIRLFSNNRKEYNYVVILSKQPFTNTGTLQFFDFPFPLHTRIFIAIMSLLNWSLISERGAVYADLPFEGTLIRVFSVHLTLWGAGNRAKEFDAVLGHIQPGVPTVVAGDFNVVEYPPMKILNWLLGAPLREGMPWYPERALFEERFAEAGFQNPLRKKITHKFSHSQLDHIVISKDLTASDAKVHTESHGSDHQPVSVRITRAL